MARISDNPNKPGTKEHKEWERLNIHKPRENMAGPEYRAAQDIADARLAKLKDQLKDTDTSVDDLLQEISGEPEPDDDAIMAEWEMDMWDAYAYNFLSFDPWDFVNVSTPAVNVTPDAVVAINASFDDLKKAADGAIASLTALDTALGDDD